MKRTLLSLAVLPSCLIGIFALQACIPMCAASVNASVQINITDADGNEVPDAIVTYSLDGSAEQPAECIGSTGTDVGCDSWSVFDEGGTYVIKAESADGTLHAETTVEVNESDCGPITKQADLVLE